MKMIVGLGNPGKEYINTRHNIGFLFIDYLCKKYNAQVNKDEKDSLTKQLIINSEKVLLVKPQTFMNLSGQAVMKLKEYYKIENKDIIVIYDDIDLEFGNVRYRENGSGGTHNGMKNIISMCKGENINRIRVGIGKPKFEGQNLADYVLSKFSKEEIENLDGIFEETYTKLINFIDKQK